MAKIILMAGTEKGAFLLQSDTRREKWEIKGPILKGWKIFDLQLDSRKQPVMYAAVNHFVYGAGIHISRDLGKTWRQLENGPRYDRESQSKLKDIWCIVPGPADEPDVLYAGVAEAGLFISRDGGRRWEELKGLSEHRTRSEWEGGLGGLCCHTVLLDPANKNRMWVAISAVGVFRSDDGGKTWNVKNDGLVFAVEAKTHKEIGSCVHRLVLDPLNPDRLYQQNHRGVFRSSNGGDSWKKIEKGLPANFGFPMVMSPHNTQTLFIVPQESDEYRFAKDGKLAVYRTTDGGDSWHPLRKGLPDNSYTGVMRQAMAADTLEQCGVYFGTSGGQIFYSRDNGEAWHAMPCHLPRILSLSTAMIE
jgi:photosystem II stability/assembly factor-like uncharacterized protein